MNIHFLPADVLLRKEGKLKRQLLAREGVSYLEKRMIGDIEDSLNGVWEAGDYLLLP